MTSHAHCFLEFATLAQLDAIIIGGMGSDALASAYAMNGNYDTTSQENTSGRSQTMSVRSSATSTNKIRAAKITLLFFNRWHRAALKLTPILRSRPKKSTD